MSLAISGENETVQVQDMDFELVKPSLPPVTGRASQDSTLTSREGDSAKPDVSPILCDGASMYSSAPRSPLAPTHAAASTESAESIDAHRQRELKWMAVFPTVPPSQARKNKKVRKLLQDGVPSSVRYLVWCHLTDSKTRALPGVYAKLGKRPHVPVFAEIEKDAEQSFPEQPQLHTAQGPLVSLLQAYLSMVPDIQYNSGLTFIAGHLLLLAPEEDAFWIFASMMDAHLRSYFATNTVQIEIDASLFSKALEAIDPVLTKKLFSTLFVGSLSVDLLHRVWDLFLYDGESALTRLEALSRWTGRCCRRIILVPRGSRRGQLPHLAHPPPACLPSATELLVLAANVKLKDDDIRKQRIKMEQQLKRTTQVRPPNGMSNVHAAAISLPRT
ncbi:rab-GTPase-TBC domain-containing protein [Boletus edulis BED1]|uniref:Rab-GTPase-TBC domain-containing protein n=1 Tax=Boletus edulis BED1 TaxID=1328754 RepID=A0AAD4BPW2_BOLED|nr:rab-GTPase-TBC domain-containing protein [Boletus edulis BED1]